MVSLTAVGRLQTSGARAVEPFHIDGALFVAVPQLAIDIPGQTPDINGGDSDTSLLVFRADNGDSSSINGWMHRVVRMRSSSGSAVGIFSRQRASGPGVGPTNSAPSRSSSNGGQAGSSRFRRFRHSPPSSGRHSPPSDGISSRWLKGSADLVSTGRTSRQ
jgi:EPTP domain